MLPSMACPADCTTSVEPRTKVVILSTYFTVPDARFARTPAPCVCTRFSVDPTAPETNGLAGLGITLWLSNPSMLNNGPFSTCSHSTFCSEKFLMIIFDPKPSRVMCKSSPKNATLFGVSPPINLILSLLPELSTIISVPEPAIPDNP